MNDETFSTQLPNKLLLTLRASTPVEILCDDASQLSATALDAFLDPQVAPVAHLVAGLRFRRFCAAQASTFQPLVQTTPNLTSLEMLECFTLDPQGVAVLSGLPKLEEL